MTILITGGSKGLGRGIGERFAEAGAHVLINYHRDDSAAEQAAKSVVQRGGTATLLKADLTSEAGIKTLISQVRDHTDTLDQIVHGAVWPHTADVLDISTNDFSQAIWINGSSLLFLVQQARDLLVEGSSVFFLSSRGSKVAVPKYAAVGAPKALAESIVRYLAVTLAEDGIRVNTVSPSTVLTDAVRKIRPNAEEWDRLLADRTPSRRTVAPTDVGSFVYHLASPELRMVTGQEFIVDGGLYVSSA